jgi:biopolymer transport protein ExbB/TolQ
MLKLHAPLAALAGFLLIPPAALASERMLTPVNVFFDAAPFPKLVMLALLAAIVAATVIAVRKMLSGPSLAGGSAFISGLRLGGPLAGALGASYTMLCGFLGVANVAFPVTLKIMAPGLAEAVLLLGLGLLAGAVAVIAHWVIEARIDREVLRG